METKRVLILLMFSLSVLELTLARTLNNTPDKDFSFSEKECDLLIKRLKRETSNALDDDDAYIEHLIKSTLHKEKQKCIDKYHLLEMPRHSEDDEQVQQLRREVSKLKDLVSVVKDQRYILNALENSASNNQNSKTMDNEELELQKVREELSKMRKELQVSQTDVIAHHNLHPSTENPSSQINDQLSKQQGEINNLKNLLQGVLIELKTSNSDTSHTPSAENNAADMSNMIKELAALQKKLSAIQHKSNGSINSDIVGIQHNAQQNSRVSAENLKHSQNTATPVSSLSSERSSESRLASERKSDDELMELLNVLVPKKSESSIESLLKSLDAGSSDDELEQRLLNLEKQVKHKKKLQFEEKLKSLEKQLSGVQSKSGGDNDLTSNSDLRRLLMKMIQNKNTEAQSKSLDNDTVLEELRELQKSIKSMSSDDDDLFEDLEEKNGQLDVTLNKLINAGGGGSGSSGHRRRKLTSGQIQALRRRLQAMKNGGRPNDYMQNGGEEFESGNYFGGNGNEEGYGSFGHIHKNDYGPHWQINQGNNGYEGGTHSGGGYGHGYPAKGYNGYDGGNGNNYGGGYGDSGAGGYAPTNQFGTPLYSPYQPAPNVYPIYSNNANSYNVAPSGGNYGAGKYFNYPKGYSNMYASNSGPVSSNVVPYAPSSVPSSANYQFFPAAHDIAQGNYHSQSNSGATSPAQPYADQPQAGPGNPASVTNLKNQIYDLQGVINTFNKPEYLQKPEDKETVYNLNKEINELKGVVSNLQEPSYMPQNNVPSINGAPGDNAAGGYPMSHSENYAPAANSPGPAHPLEHPPPPSMQQHSNGGPPAYSPETPHARSFMEEIFRRKRSVDHDLQARKHEEAFQTLALLIGNALNLLDEGNGDFGFGQREALETPEIFQELNEKIAGVRKQLDRHLQQHFYQPRTKIMRPVPALVPLANLRTAPVRMSAAPVYQRTLPTSWRTPQLSTGTLRSNTDYGNYYDNNYNEGVDKKDKKSDIFDKIFDKIIDKVISKLEKAFPKILEVIFGKFEYSKSYSSGYGEYGNDNQGYNNGNELIETFHSMGLSGLLPMIIVKILSKFQYVMYFLQKSKFFKSFLVPALILLLVAGAVIFLVWWLQPNDDHYNHYDQVTYDNSYQNYNKGKMYRNSQQQEITSHPRQSDEPSGRYSKPGSYYSDKDINQFDINRSDPSKLRYRSSTPLERNY